ncbi:hypothetical protein L1887_31867 [Cichorium endivia]|nr:hypothetical protein L1887_31867 [Cichorium endivia]
MSKTGELRKWRVALAISHRLLPPTLTVPPLSLAFSPPSLRLSFLHSQMLCSICNRIRYQILSELLISLAELFSCSGVMYSMPLKDVNKADNNSSIRVMDSFVNHEVRSHQLNIHKRFMQIHPLVKPYSNADDVDVSNDDLAPAPPPPPPTFNS